QILAIMGHRRNQSGQRYALHSVPNGEFNGTDQRGANLFRVGQSMTAGGKRDDGDAAKSRLIEVTDERSVSKQSRQLRIVEDADGNQLIGKVKQRRAFELHA